MNNSSINNPLNAIVMQNAFEKLNWGSTDVKTIEKHMQSAINEDPLLKDPTLISVSLTSTDDTKLFELIGKVGDQKEKDRVEEIVRKNSADNAKV
ncbi:hypothetical protein [Oceanispirochaeta sp.]|jgi:hypothetical protein|uniref:hypothetical protein n=1 Tax=Oceanispirochaeta sp. TaxID=2035350 RepID=UPI0026129E16|nr:hypothetical protein [Oceanispirochaeta sp.]MDA3958933.1 hypothetical protein [Oceanispirochaeta sp.]